MTKTVSAKALEVLASNIERHAKENLESWIVLGRSGRYSEEMEKAAAVRHALGIKNIAARRAFLVSRNIDA